MFLSTLADIVIDSHLICGCFVNCLLLFAIRRYSRPSLGTYKFLLATFASFDVFLCVIHAFARTTVVVVDVLFGVVTDSFVEDRRITAAFTGFFTVPFVLMNIHFLYRFWAIRHPHRILLFSNNKFIVVLIVILITVFISWCQICTRVMSGEVGERATIVLREEYEKRYGKLIIDGWILVNFAEEDGMRTRAIASMLCFDAIMIISFSIAVTLATLTYHHISNAGALLSEQTLSLQFKLLIAVYAQTFVPLIFVYLPYMAVNHLAFLRLPAHSLDRACMQLTSCFPAWDAIVIIVLIRDYREGLLSRIRPKKPIVVVETVMSMSVLPMTHLH